MIVDVTRARARARARIGLAILLAACSSAPRHTTNTEITPPPTTGLVHGMASFYSEPQMTASGERFDKHALTAAHRTLSFGTRVRVTNQRNGRSVVVRINDRGPFSHGRIIDLSEAAARELQMIDAGVVPVTLEVLSR